MARKVIVGDRVKFRFAGSTEFGKVVETYKKDKNKMASITSDDGYNHRIKFNELKIVKDDKVDDMPFKRN